VSDSVQYIRLSGNNKEKYMSELMLLILCWCGFSFLPCKLYLWFGFRNDVVVGVIRCSVGQDR